MGSVSLRSDASGLFEYMMYANTVCQGIPTATAASVEPQVCHRVTTPSSRQVDFDIKPAAPATTTATAVTGPPPGDDGLYACLFPVGAGCQPPEVQPCFPVEFGACVFVQQQTATAYARVLRSSNGDLQVGVFGDDTCLNTLGEIEFPEGECTTVPVLGVNVLDVLISTTCTSCSSISGPPEADLYMCTFADGSATCDIDENEAANVLCAAWVSGECLPVPQAPTPAWVTYERVLDTGSVIVTAHTTPDCLNPVEFTSVRVDQDCRPLLLRNAIVLSFSVRSDCLLCGTLKPDQSLEKCAAHHVEADCNALVPDCVWLDQASVQCVAAESSRVIGQHRDACNYFPARNGCGQLDQCRVSAAQCVDKDLDETTTLLYQFDETAGLRVFDATSHNRHATIVRGTEANRDVGFASSGALRLHGWEWLQVTQEPHEILPARFGMSCVVKPLKTHDIRSGTLLTGVTGQRYLFGMFQIDTVVPNDPLASGFALSVATNGVALYRVDAEVGTMRLGLYQAELTSFVTLHFAARDDTLRVAVDGREVIRGRAPGRRFYWSTDQRIGSDLANINAFAGVVDTFQVYRSDAAIADSIGFFDIVDHATASGLASRTLCEVQYDDPYIVTALQIAPLITRAPSIMYPDNVAAGSEHAFVLQSVPESFLVSVNADTGALSIDPQNAAVGDASFVVRVTNPEWNIRHLQKCNAAAVIRVSVRPPLLAAYPDPVNFGTVGGFFQLAAPQVTGGQGLYRYGASGLPEGLTIDLESGDISGIPARAGWFNSSVFVNDAAAAFVTVYAILNISASLESFSDTITATVGAPMELQILELSGGRPVYIFEGQGLPPGLTVNATTGGLVGVPRGEAGVFTVQLRGRDQNQATLRTRRQLVLFPEIELKALFEARVIEHIAFETLEPLQYNISGGGRGLATQLVGAPPGVVAGLVTDARSGGPMVEVVGVPTTAGTFSFRVVVSDENGFRATSANVSMIISAVSSANDNLIDIVAGVFGGIIIVLIALLVLYVRHKREEENQPYNFDEILAAQEGKLVPKEIPRHKITFLESIGSGFYGQVFKGVLDQRAETGMPSYIVALKTLKDDHTAKEKRELLAEAALMAQVVHPNCVGLVGVCTIGEPVAILLQYCERGSLQEFLQGSLGSGLAEGPRLFILRDVAAGMAYLSEHAIVHRDLAARNVLLDSSFSCKVSDFGRARDLGDQSAYYQSAESTVPVRWMAPEVLASGKHTATSDTWSFGIVTYEVFTNAEKPYKGMSNADVWNQTSAGYRLSRPRAMSKDVYALCTRCWAEDPTQRPLFPELLTIFEELCKENRGMAFPSDSSTTTGTSSNPKVNSASGGAKSDSKHKSNSKSNNSGSGAKRPPVQTLAGAIATSGSIGSKSSKKQRQSEDAGIRPAPFSAAASRMDQFLQDASPPTSEPRKESQPAYDTFNNFRGKQTANGKDDHGEYARSTPNTPATPARNPRSSAAYSTEDVFGPGDKRVAFQYDPSKPSNEHMALPAGSHTVAAADLPSYVDELIASKEITTQFDSLVKEFRFSTMFASKEVNRPKNRYRNVLPFDHTRVVLKRDGHDSDTDYINASYLDGFARRRAYIAAQGPLWNTLDDFWYMVWQERATTIVMITPLVERGQKKCEQYWPNVGESLQYGPFSVSTRSEEEQCNGGFWSRQLSVTHADNGETHQLTQYQYCAWPDHGVPDSCDTFLEFLSAVRAQRSPDHPVLTHCSAGVGRTGILISVDVALDSLDLLGVVALPHVVVTMRKQRNMMVQTTKQFEFCYRAIVAALQKWDRLFLHSSSSNSIDSASAKPTGGEDYPSGQDYSDGADDDESNDDSQGDGGTASVFGVDYSMGEDDDSQTALGGDHGTGEVEDNQTVIGGGHGTGEDNDDAQPVVGGDHGTPKDGNGLEHGLTKGDTQDAVANAAQTVVSDPDDAAVDSGAVGDGLGAMPAGGVVFHTPDRTVSDV
eukprot:m.351963 g.351963  ORF g.351963 m.351963 type:complete len:1960 (+) comp19898_c14_seq4:3668-9547(+)